MIFSSKVDELKAFIGNHVGMNNSAKDELYDYVEKWAEDTRAELGLPAKAGLTIGISFDSEIELVKLPSFGIIESGFYENNKLGLRVEVIIQNEQDGSVIFNSYCGEDTGNLEAMSYGMFKQLFERTIV